MAIRQSHPGTHKLLLCSTALLIGATRAAAQDPTSLPAYQPHGKPAGTLRVWGNDNQAKLFELWQAGFHKYQPAVKFDVNLKSTATGIGALYCGVADLSLLGREIWPSETLGFQKVFRYEPLGFSVATGSYNAEGKTWPLIIFVHKDNPLTKLKLKQVDAVFGAERKRGEKQPIVTWGQLGLTGEWANQPIHVFGYDTAIPGFSFFFQQAVFKGSDRWTCNLREFYNRHNPDGSLVAVAGKLMTKELGEDRYGIAYTGIQFRTPLVKPLALAEDDGRAYVEPTKENVANRTYPLTRAVYIFINRAPGKPIDPKLHEFLRYVFSRQGQEDVAREGDFIPMTRELVSEQLKKLE